MAKPSEKTTKKSTESKAPKAAAKETKKVSASAVEAKAKTKAPKAAAAPKKVKTAPADKKGRCGGKSCRIENCKGEYKAKGYCKPHYKEWRHGKYGKTRYTACSDFGCTKPMATNRFGFCEEHYQNYYVKGMEQAKVVAPAPAEEKKSDAAVA